MVRGDRVIFYYLRERIEFRNNVVVEVGPIDADPVKRPVGASPEPASPPAVTTPDPNAPSTPTTPVPGGPSATVPPTGAATPEPKVEIKLVRPPGSKDGRTPALPESVIPKVIPETPPKKAPVEVKETPPPKLPGSRVTGPAQPSAEAIAARKAAERAAALEKEKKAKAAREARRRLDNADEFETTEGILTTRNIVIALIVVAGAVGFFLWRSRPRPPAPAPTPVSNLPSDIPIAPLRPANPTTFSTEFLDKLEWTRFEELVAAYYSKTGVVATRTNAGPESPVHIKISWKGEPRPFAYVQCIAHPSGLVDAKSVQALVSVLAAEDIRRGYVVTPGKFNGPAREVASEKHVTLMPGDTFLEKLNALPVAARAEIMQAIKVVG